MSRPRWSPTTSSASLPASKLKSSPSSNRSNPTRKVEGEWKKRGLHQPLMKAALLFISPVFALPLRRVVALARAYSQVGAGLDGERGGAEAAGARLRPIGVGAQDVLLREVCGYLHEGVGKLPVAVRDEDLAAGLRGELLQAPLAREVAQVRALAVARLHCVDLTVVREDARHRLVEVEVADGVRAV